MGRMIKKGLMNKSLNIIILLWKYGAGTFGILSCVLVATSQEGYCRTGKGAKYKEIRKLVCLVLMGEGELRDLIVAGLCCWN